MMRRSRKLHVLICLGAVLAGLIALLVSGSVEPEYNGRKMSDWIANYPAHKQRDWRETEVALEFFGTNAIPEIMNVFAKPSPFWRRHYDGLYIRAQMNGWSLARRLPRPRPWVFDSRYAPEVFGAIGSNSVPLLTHFLEDDRPRVAAAAASGLGWFGVQAECALPELKKAFAEPGSDEIVRKAITAAIREIEISTRAASRQYLVTVPNGSSPAVANAPRAAMNDSDEFRTGWNHGNGILWVFLKTGPYVIEDSEVRADGSFSMKFGWWRGQRGAFSIEGRRMDAPAGPMRYSNPPAKAYGDLGFLPSTLVFPSEGLWEITGHIDDQSITFVILITKSRG